MEKIYELIAEKEQNLESLEKEKMDLEQNMANPTLLNNKAQEIEDVKVKISLLSDIVGLAEEAGDDSAKKIMSDVKDHYEEMKQVFAEQENKEEPIENLNKLTQILENMMNNDLSDTDESSEDTEPVLKSDSSRQNSGLSTNGNGPTNSGKQSTDMSDDTDLPDYSSFDDTG